MKKKIVIVFFIYLFNFGFSQNNMVTDMEIVYEMTFKADSTVNKKTEDILTLYIGKDFSLFQNDKKKKIDSLIFSQLHFKNTSSKPMYKVNHVIFKNFKKDEITYSEIIDNINFGYNEKLTPMVWKITSDKKSIQTYQCIKAETVFGGRKFIAWYTEQVPINDGPYKFSGLPGLILEVYDDQDNFHYKLLAIISKKQNILYNDKLHFTEKKKLIETKINLIKKITKYDVKVNPIEKK
ncbi:GLPGLI family protein [Amniculibacterium aquaticum]|uniref:GLPGLI family protein n=1 Tax=Amniculibacterium aquaticum TaxID=2479858 RepID=UPI000F5B2FF5|nr:GLPGLI family protein [Amniculibacterium aquaticum]